MVKTAAGAVLCIFGLAARAALDSIYNLLSRSSLEEP
jgi:hypothetical protein